MPASSMPTSTCKVSSVPYYPSRRGSGFYEALTSGGGYDSDDSQLCDAIIKQRLAFVTSSKSLDTFSKDKALTSYPITSLQIENLTSPTSFSKLERIAGIAEISDDKVVIRWQSSPTQFTFHQDLNVEPSENRFAIVLQKNSSGALEWGYSTIKKTEFNSQGFSMPTPPQQIKITDAINSDLQALTNLRVFGCSGDIHII